MKNKHNTILEWIEKADHDLGAAKLIFLHMPTYFDTIAFHCQQAVEKYLKAILISVSVEFQRTHDLVYLLDVLSEKIEVTEEMYDKAIVLNGCSVQIRYPDNKIFLTNEELEVSIQIADFFRSFAIQSIGIRE